MRKTYAPNAIVIGFLVGLLVAVKVNVILGILAGLGVSVLGWVLISSLGVPQIMPEMPLMMRFVKNQ